MPRKAVLSLEAERDLSEIATYIAANNKTAAIGMVQRISRGMAMLAGRPFIGRLAPETAQADMRRWPVPPYVIFYRVRDTSVQVSRILHGSRELEDPSLYKN